MSAFVQRCRLAVFGLQERLGWIGGLSVVVFFLATMLAAYFWMLHLEVTMELAKAPPAPPAARALPIVRSANAQARPALPASGEASALLKQLHDATQRNGLIWVRAEYRQLPVANDALASLEIRATFKGPYLGLRQMLTEMLDREPALALKELALSRPNLDTLEVEAQTRWVLYLSDGWDVAATPTAEGSR